MTWTQKQAIKTMQDWKDTHPCVDCSAKAGYPVFYRYFQMQFDHAPESKVFNLGTHGRKLTEAELLFEMSKCEVVCGTCHLARSHFRQKQPRKKLGTQSWSSPS